MPLTAKAHNQLADDDLCRRLEHLYNTSPEFADGRAAVAHFKAKLAKGDLLYVGMFNANPIAAVGMFNNGKPDSRLLQYIAVHPANRGRGIAEKLVAMACQQEQAKGIQTFEPGCGALHRILARLDLLTV